MEGATRATEHHLKFLEELEREPFAFDFYSALRRFECAHRSQPRLGEAQRPAQEPLRLAQEPSTAFAPASIAGFERRGSAQKPRLSVLFFGLFGPHGPLPLHLTEFARERLRHANDPTFTRFADIFHHRLLLLFYRAWARAQPTLGQDRAPDNPFERYLGALFGFGMNSVRNRPGTPDRARLFLAGRFVFQTRNAEGLAAILSEYFELPVQVLEFVGDWLELPAASRWRLGCSPENGLLGQNTIAGSRVWQCAHKFRIVLGPLNRAQFDRMLPGGESLPRLRALVKDYIGDELHWDVRLVLKEEVETALELGRSARLGWNTSLGRGYRQREDLIVDPFRKGTSRVTARES